jgi:predicted Zn finger-like uncharacterized protein
MPEIISCPECERKLRVPDHLLGKKVKCPGCGTMFTGQGRGAEDTPKSKSRAAAPPEERIEEKPRAGRRPVVPPPEEEYEEDRPRRRRREEEEYDEDDRPRARRRQEVEEEDEDYPRSARADAYDDWDEPGATSRRARVGWRKVSSGLHLVTISGWIDVALNGFSVIFYVILLVSVFALVASSSGPQAAPAPAFRPGGPPPPSSAPSGGLAALGIFSCLFSALFLIGGLATVVLKSIGYGFCMGVPTTRGGLKTLAITTFSLFIGGLVMALPSCLLGFLVLAAMLLIFASLVVFVFFLRGVALEARDRPLAGRLLTLLIAWGVYIALYFVSMGLLYAYGYSLIAGSLPGLGGGAGPPNAGAVASGAVTMIYVSLVLMAVMLLAGLGLYVWYVLLVRQTRGVVERRLLRGA